MSSPEMKVFNFLVRPANRLLFGAIYDSLRFAFLCQAASIIFNEHGIRLCNDHSAAKEFASPNHKFKDPFLVFGAK